MGQNVCSPSWDGAGVEVGLGRSWDCVCERKQAGIQCQTHLNWRDKEAMFGLLNLWGFSAAYKTKSRQQRMSNSKLMKDFENRQKICSQNVYRVSSVICYLCVETNNYYYYYSGKVLVYRSG